MNGISRRALGGGALATMGLAACVPNYAQGASKWTDLMTADRWRQFKGESVDPRWQFANGELALTAGGAGDLVTREEYSDFEFQFGWKISEGGNSGVMFGVQEGDNEQSYFTGPEYQVLDNERHADGADPKHRAGANYDLDAPSEDATRPVGEWNDARLIVLAGNVQHWLNGKKVVEYSIRSAEWEAKVRASKFVAWPGYGRAGSGRLCLQDHGDKVWYRAMRVRTLREQIVLT